MRSPGSVSGPAAGVSGTLTTEVVIYNKANSTSLSTKDSSNPRVQIPSYLELCVNTGEFHKTLGEIGLSGITSDEGLFSAIKKIYLQRRGFRAKYFLLKPVAVHFVRVGTGILYL